jgi:signal transduction histidine kinase/ActR/RegA family two-component response regulator
VQLVLDLAPWSLHPDRTRASARALGTLAGLLDIHPSIVDPEVRRQSRLLSVCILVLTAIFVCVDVTLSLSAPGYQPPWLGYVLLVGTLLLNRAGRYRAASILVMAMFPLVGFGQVYLGTTTMPFLAFGYVALAPMLGAIFLPIWGVVALTLMNMAGVLLAPVFVSQLADQVPRLVGPLSMNAMVGVLASLYMHHRNGVEADRRRALLAELGERERLEDRLRQAQKLEALGKLAGGIAHDFNNVLMVILGNAALLQRRDASPEVLRIESAASSAAALTRQLLAFGRRAVIEPTVLDVGTVVGESVEMVRRLIGEQVVVEHDLPVETLAARLDRAQIEQVLINLATNARDAMPEGGTLRIELEAVTLGPTHPTLAPDAAPGRYVCISVSDEGIGMDPTTRERIFEPFFTTKEKGSGTGLGLASVFGSVSQAGGFIRVWSEPGHGTRFELFFPRADENELSNPPPRISEKPARRGRERVLLVEDDEGVRAVVTLILSEAGYDVLAAATLGDARAQWTAAESPFSLVILDVVLPDGRGLELAAELRVAQPLLPLMCMSGYADGLDGGAMPQGMLRLQKPFTADELLGQVRAALDAGARSEALSA